MSFEILRLLKDNNVPIQSWGQDRANSTDDLIREISDGEARLVIEDGKIVRLLDMLDLDVFYTDENETTFKLKEDRQVYVDGRVRKRDLPVSLMEKMKLGEKTEEAIARALSEELQIKGGIDIKNVKGKDVFEPSISYPGTMVRSKIYKGNVLLSKDQFKSEGYQEIQPGRKITYFVWEKCNL